MSATSWSVIVAGALGLGVLGAAADDFSQLQLGKQEYLDKCAVCHGESGLGAGDSTEALLRKPGDLTSYARRNGGAFPTQLAWATIDGRTLDEQAVRNREMPLFGQAYRSEAVAHPTYKTPEAYVSERIDALVSYVSTLQMR